jgi:translation initiation factor 2-alpha kinase 4
LTTVSVSRLELVGWLQHQIAEQKRIDAATTGAPTTLAEVVPDVLPAVKDTAALSDVQQIPRSGVSK